MSADATRTARHVAIIMDGNGRWAQSLGQPRSYGHYRGAERVRDIVRAAPSLGIEILTLFAFSTENWRRPDYEVNVLMRLFRRYMIREIDELDRAEVNIRFLGERHRLPPDMRRMMDQIEERTARHTDLRLQIALSYGARAEITRGVREIARDIAEGRLDPDAIDEDTVSNALDTRGTPDPDLVIRTSGEYRISNFLLWQAAYAEFAFVKECWPDFTAELLAEVVADYSRRERRFGAVSAS